MAQTQFFRGVQTSTFMDNGELIGLYRGTPVARMKDNTITLNTGGWRSFTTKTRMNQFSNNFVKGSFCVYQKDYSWFVKLGNEVLPFNGQTITFEV